MSTPFFSIVVPTYERHESLSKCVRSIQKMDYPRDRFELIIVDDGSNVPIKDACPAIQESCSVSILSQANKGPAAARNLGAEHAKGDFLAFIDDDCIPTPTWLAELARPLSNHQSQLVGGRTINGLVTNLYSATSQLIVDEAYSYFLSHNSDLSFIASNNMAVSAQLFFANGGFNPLFRTSEDRDFCDRWIMNDLPLTYVSNAIVHHYHHLSLTSFAQQHFGYGRGAYQFHRARARRGSGPFTPDTKFYYAVLRFALRQKSFWRSLTTVGLLGIWQSANLAGFVCELIRQRISIKKTHPGTKR